MKFEIAHKDEDTRTLIVWLEKINDAILIRTQRKVRGVNDHVGSMTLAIISEEGIKLTGGVGVLGIDTDIRSHIRIIK